MNITKKVRMIRKLAKEVEGEVEDNYFLMHSRKYYLKRGKIYTTNHYTKPVGNITNQGEIEIHKKHRKSKSLKVVNIKNSNNLGSKTSNNSGNKNMSRRINLNKNKNMNSTEEPTSVTNLNRNTVMHETEEPEVQETESPIVKNVEPVESSVEEEPLESSVEEEPLESSVEEPVEESTVEQSEV